MKTYVLVRLRRGGGDASLWRRLHLSCVAGRVSIIGTRSDKGLGMRGFYPWFLSMVAAAQTEIL